MHDANVISKAPPQRIWGIEYGSTPVMGTLMMNDFFPRHATMLGEIRISGEKPEIKGATPSTIYLVIASVGQ